MNKYAMLDVGILPRRVYRFRSCMLVDDQFGTHIMIHLYDDALCDVAQRICESTQSTIKTSFWGLWINVILGRGPFPDRLGPLR